MNGRGQDGRRDAWGTTRLAALCPVLAVLIAALLLCLGPTGHAAADRGTAPTAAAPAGATAPHPASEAPSAGGHRTDHHPVAAHPGPCPSDGECCTRSPHGAHAVLPAAPQPVPVVLPRLPVHAAGAAVPRAPGLPSARGAPDLHVLQIQRI
ncbi:hypothetical protein [Streptomyces sp. NPDC058461]|uniref:hypothetical protein n=1 Tax=Streptomyces sp. NPDC058461 TaxID=3346509 RepID=UPI003647D557